MPQTILSQPISSWPPRPRTSSKPLIEKPYIPYFLTLTYERTPCSARERWLTIVMDINRFLQRLRRTRPLDDWHYVRSLEYHKDGYPHAHLLLLGLRDYRERKHYVANSFRSYVKGHWPYGLSDVQSTRYEGSPGWLRYLLKEVVKSGSARHMWSMVLEGAQCTSKSTNPNAEVPPVQPYAAYANFAHMASPVIHVLSSQKQVFAESIVAGPYQEIDYIRVKLLTWSLKALPILNYLLRTGSQQT